MFVSGQREVMLWSVVCVVRFGVYVGKVCAGLHLSLLRYSFQQHPVYDGQQHTHFPSLKVDTAKYIHTYPPEHNYKGLCEEEKKTGQNGHLTMQNCTAMTIQVTGRDSTATHRQELALIHTNQSI